jgi:5'-nucleotidase (lipoprotein e(P4) family)
MLAWLLCALALAEAPVAAAPKPVPATQSLQIKYVRDAFEHQASTAMIYRLAEEEVLEQVKAAKAKRGEWVVVLDIDETVLDNSEYQRRQAADYGRPFELSSWNAWCAEKAAPPIAGAVAFVANIKKAGGKIAYVSNRDASVKDATAQNLEAVGLWTGGELLCPLTDDKSKAPRRAQLRAGSGDCSFAGTKPSVVFYFGDQQADFPTAEEDPSVVNGFGTRTFVIPNPMYGDWTSAVTRQP